MISIEETILRALATNKEYAIKAVPFLKEGYFHDKVDNILFGEIRDFFVQYKTLPSREALILKVNQRGDLTEDGYKEVLVKIKDITSTKNAETNLDYLVEKTEEFCQDKAMYNAIMESIQILDGRDKKRTKNMIPELLRSALSVNFDVNIGHDYFEDAEKRYNFYIEDRARFPCDLDMLNRITRGGVAAKTLNIGMADTNVGKTILLCHLAASYIAMGYNVAYVSGEEGEEILSKRIDANLLDIDIKDLDKGLDRSLFMGRVERARGKIRGRLKVKEYPSGGFHAGTIRMLLDEYKNKQDFVPDILIVDYLGLMCSEKWAAGSVRHDLYMQYVSEELRNIGKERDIPVWSAWQTNRDGAENMDVGKKNVADSYGVLRTCDLMFVMVTNRDLEERKQLMFIQLKSRYGPTDQYNKFVVGVDKSRMRMYDVDMGDLYAVGASAAESKQKMLDKQDNKKKLNTSGFQF